MAVRRLPFLTPGAVAMMAVLVAPALGILLAHRPGAGLALAIAIAFVVVALLDLPLAIALWVGLAFSRNLPFVWVGPSVAAIGITICWLGASRPRWQARAAIAARHRRVVVPLTIFFVWIGLSALWAGDPAASGRQAWAWWIAGAVAVVVASTPRRARDVRLIAGGFVIGAAISVLAGLVLTGLEPATSALQTSVDDAERRLGGGLGDPNYLAAGLVPAIVLAGALLGGARSAIERGVLLISMAICAVGLAATESRGGFVAALVTTLGAMLVFRQRARVALALLVVIVFAALYFVSTPGTLDRVTEIDGGGSGRADLWQVAWRIGETRPVAGIGLNNFLAEGQDFVRRPGALRNVRLLVEQPALVHNTYLQTYVETGIVGFTLLMAALAGLLAIPWRAARRFDRLGEPSLSTLARGVLLAQVGALVSLVFLSDGADERWWVLFGLGPALFALTRPSASGAR